jgi:hypothetical protein
MAHQEFQVIFRGELLPDWPTEAVKANLAKLFKADEARIEVLFSGRPTIIKRGLSQEEGERYRLLFERAGAVCEVVPSAPLPPPSTAPHGIATGTGERSRVPGISHGAPSDSAQVPPRTAKKREAPPATAGGLEQRLNSLRRKVRDIDTEAAGEKASALFEGVSTTVRSGLAKYGLASPQRSKLIGAAVLGLGLLIAMVLLLGGRPKPMPIEQEVFDKFAKQYYRGIRKSDLAEAGTKLLVERAHEVTEDMGYDFDRTLLYWLLHKDRVESQRGLDIYRAILVEPVAVAVSAGLSGIEDQVAPETRRVFETMATIPPGVDLTALRMIQACPSEGNRLKHDDLLGVLEDNDIPIDASQPDLTIADVFFDLERAGFIKIQRRWENDVQYSDIEVLAPEAMLRTEQQLAYLAEIKAQMEPP